MVKRTSTLILSLALAIVALTMVARAQQRPAQFYIEPLSDAKGQVGLGLALRRLTSVGTFMHTTAHPDDENNSVIALYARGQGMRVALVTATRGDGGQNEIGPELFDAIGVLRTEELLAAHRWDGAEQYFTRAVDFGFSFSPEETIQKWGHDEILGDFVRMIRTIRPDVVVTLPPTGTGGGQHHMVSAMLTYEAFAAAADPSRFPEQLQQGLRPWQIKKLYQPAGGGFGGFGAFGGPGGGPQGFGPPPAPGAAPGAGNQGAAGRGGRGAGAAPADPDAKVATIDTSGYDVLLGCTIGELGGVAASMHKCQGRSPIQGFPQGPSGARYKLAATVLDAQKNKNETSLFEGIDTSLATGLVGFAGDNPPPALRQGISAIADHAAAAQQAFLTPQSPAATLPDLLAGLTGVRTLRTQLASMALSDAAKYEIDFRLEQKERQFEHAIVLAHGLRIDAIADDGVVMPNQPIRVVTNVANHGADDVAVKSVTLSGFTGAASCTAEAVRASAAYSCQSALRIPATARLTGPYWVRSPDAGRIDI